MLVPALSVQVRTTCRSKYGPTEESALAASPDIDFDGCSEIRILNRVTQSITGYERFLPSNSERERERAAEKSAVTPFIDLHVQESVDD